MPSISWSTIESLLANSYNIYTELTDNILRFSFLYWIASRMTTNSPRNLSVQDSRKSMVDRAIGTYAQPATTLSSQNDALFKLMKELSGRIGRMEKQLDILFQHLAPSKPSAPVFTSRLYPNLPAHAVSYPDE